MSPTIAASESEDNPAQDARDLAAISPRHSKWDARKAGSVTAAAIIAKRHPKKGKTINACCDQIALHWHETPDGERFGKMTGTHRCHNPKVCDVCGATKANQWRRELKKVLPRIMKDHPTYRFVFLTLSVRNCPIAELHDTLKAMSAAWFKLIRRKEVKSILKGFLRGTEVTKGKDGPMRAHPHFHALLVVPQHYFTGQYYIPQKRWRELWQECAKLDYDPSIDIQAVKDTDKAIEESIKLASYSVKKSEAVADPDWFNEFHDQTLGFRFTNTGGLFRDYLKDEPANPLPADEDGAETEAPTEAAPLDEIDVFQYSRPRQRYRKTRTVARSTEPA
jgi:plasmid rolling circle replication initiator protein Rep